MDRQWRPSFSFSSPSSSSPSTLPLKPLQDQFSRLSLSGSDSASQFANLPRPNNNDSYYHDLQELNRIRELVMAATSQEVVTNTLPGPSSYYSNLINNNVPSSWLGSGSSSGSGSGSGYVSPSDYFAMLPRNEVQPVLGNNHSNNNNHHYSNPDFLTILLYNSFLQNYSNNSTYHHRRNHVNYNNNHPRRNTRATTTTTIPIPRTRGLVGGVTPPLMSWEEIKGSVVTYANEEKYSLMMINKFELGHMEGLKMVISEIKEGLTQILLNSCGNEFFHKLLDILDHQDIVDILKALVANQHDFLRVCLDNVGTRGVQKLLSCLDSDSLEEKAIVMNAIRGGVVALAKNMNGFHCLKALQNVYEITGSILNEVADHCVEIAMDRSGCCVLQNCILVLAPERDRIIYEIVKHALELSENDYGNYVVQYIIGLKEFHITQEVLRALQGYLVRLTKNKFGSHVVEKFLKEGHEEFVEPIINEVFGEKDDANFLEILQHPTGNFVAQSALRRTKMMHLKHGVCMGLCLYQRLVERIEGNYTFLHSHIHGKRVLSLVKCHRFR